MPCAWGVSADGESAVKGPCAGRSCTETSVVSSSWYIMVGFMVGRDVFVAALCHVCLYSLFISIKGLPMDS